MSDQNNAFKSVMVAAIGIAGLVVLVVVIALIRSYTVSEGIEDPNAEEQIRPVAVFARTDNNKAPEVAASTVATSTESPANTDAAVDAPAVDAPKDPAHVYASFCHICHDTGVAGAPRKGDKAAWAPRIATGMDALHHSVLTGKGAMPPRGNTSGVSDDELKATVDYLVNMAR